MRLLAQVELAIAQPELLADGLVLVDLERRRLGVGEQVEGATASSTSPVGSAGFTAPSSRATSSPSAEITSSARRRSGRRVRLRRLLGPEHELEQPAACRAGR